MKTNSDVKPKQIYPLGDGTYHFNYNIEKVTTQDEQGERESYNCDTIHVNKIDYATIVATMIAERYSVSDELALHRQREEKVEEFQEYFDYCEECKAISRDALNL